jgi:16S rRNA (guanine527-N7)-methyltransferase
VDKVKSLELLLDGAHKVGVSLSQDAANKLLQFREALTRWNRKVNLTAINDPKEILEKHFIDSLAVVPQVSGATSLLDIGSGGGFPGIPIKLALPELDVTLLESSGRKVAFLKHAIATLGMGDKIRAAEGRAEGQPQAEKVPMAEVVISRAVQAPADWVALGRKYVAGSGCLIAMLGSKWGPREIEAIARQNGGTVEVRPYHLPFSGARRAFAVFRF